MFSTRQYVGVYIPARVRLIHLVGFRPDLTCQSEVLLQDLRANEFCAPSEVHFEAIHLLDWCCSWFEKQEPAHLRASELFHHAIIDDQVRVIEYTAKLQMLLESADRSTCAGDSDVIGAWIQQGTEVKKGKYFTYLYRNSVPLFISVFQPSST